jgi:addiction module HigA family antidote
MATKTTKATKEQRVTRGPALPPTHPGAILRETVLPHLGLSVKEAARQLRITRQTLHRILAEESSVTPEMAVRLGKFCGNGAGIWLRLQQAYDLHHAERKLHDELKQIPTHNQAA